MMWGKAVVFGDGETAERILRAPGGDPGTVKRLGRAVRGFDAPTWHLYARRVVEEGCLRKFAQNPAARSALWTSGNGVLAEAAPGDLVWGIGTGLREAQRRPARTWRGRNWLGQVLMRVRDRLQSEGEGGSSPPLRGRLS
jgi:ribA/ribD-fused uncharacterized protein